MCAWLCSLLRAAPSSPLLHRFLPSHYVSAAALHVLEARGAGRQWIPVHRLRRTSSSGSLGEKKTQKTCESIAGDALSPSHDASWSHLLQTDGVRPS